MCHHTMQVASLLDQTSLQSGFHLLSFALMRPLVHILDFPLQDVSVQRADSHTTRQTLFQDPGLGCGYFQN